MNLYCVYMSSEVKLGSVTVRPIATVTVSKCWGNWLASQACMAHRAEPFFWFSALQHVGEIYAQICGRYNLFTE